MSNEACCLLFIVSAPSGTGKTTIVERLVRVTDRLKLSRSYTSRAPRGDEVDGVDYNFVSRAAFETMIANGEFLEHAEVFGNFYGTRASDATSCLASGDDVVLVIDVQGARKVRSAGLPHVAIFVLPPYYDALENRLRGRSKDSDEAIRKRLAVAREEVSAFEHYDYVVINDHLESSVERLKSIVLAERSKLQCMRPQALEILKSFNVNGA
jgi:guanylate kinase